MKDSFNSILRFLLAVSLLCSCSETKKGKAPNAILIKNATFIDGNGGVPLEHTDILLNGDTIAAIGKSLDTSDVELVDASGKTVMPALISTHVHIGTLKGTKTATANYTRENILSQLKKYEDYGVLNVLSMGTDRPGLFAGGFYDSLKTSFLPGSRMYSAGFGFGVPGGAPAPGGIMDLLYRPAIPAQVAAEMDSLAGVHPAVIKMWVDDFAGKYTRMAPEIYKMIIEEAHKHNLRAASHVWYLADARRLVADGIDILAHSIRDSVADDVLVKEMKRKNVSYIPTLTLDDFGYVYAGSPDWINDDFFKTSLDPGVYEMITAGGYSDSLKSSPGYARNLAAFATALRNLQKLYNAGILVCLGTDSGAMPLRTQGFSEHLELELMVEAGLTPLQAIGVATKNASLMLRINDHFGTLEKGKVADMIILSGNPAENIKNTRKIDAVYKAGKMVSKGPGSR